MGQSASSSGSPAKFGCFGSILEKRPYKNAQMLKQVKDCSMEHVLSTCGVHLRRKCDQCTSYIWGKAYTCSSCKLVCHKKCLSKVLKHCSTSDSEKDIQVCRSQFIGVDLRDLTSDTQPVPAVIEKLLEHVERNGLDTEGIYRMSGVVSNITKLRQHLEKDPQAVYLDDYPIHTVTGLVKQWLRELPEPLVSLEHYRAFLDSMELSNVSEQIRHIYKVLDMLPLAHINTLERLISHMIRVARAEVQNRMSTHALAIVIAPNIIRSPATVDVAEMLKDISKATMCLELILNEQMRLFEMLKEQEQPECPDAITMSQLKLKRRDTLKPPADEAAVSESDSAL